MSTTKEAFVEWHDKTLDTFDGGVVLDHDSELLDENQLLKAISMVLRDKQLRSDTGYIPTLTPVYSTPRKHISYKTPAGIVHELLICDGEVYQKDEDQWQVVDGGVATTLTNNEALNSITLEVVDDAGFADNDIIAVELSDGQFGYVTINGTPVANVITLDAPGLPVNALTGDRVIKLGYLNGGSAAHVTAKPIPWDDWLVFTNGVDFVMRFDPATNDIDTISGITNVVCQTLEIYDNSLILGNTVEAGTAFKYRYKYCAKGDVTNWTTLEAGHTDLLNIESPIMQLLNLGPFLIIYRDKAIHRIAISSSFLRRFDTDTAVSGIGVFSNHAVVDLVDKHILWGNDGFYTYQGGFDAPLMENGLYNVLFGPNGELAEAVRHKSFVVYLKKYKEVLFCYQKTGDSGVQNAVRYHEKVPQGWMTRRFGHILTGFGTQVGGSSFEWDDLTSDWIAYVGDWSSFGASSAVEQPTFCAPDHAVVYNYLTSSDNDGNTDQDISNVFETKDFSDPIYLLRHDYLDVFVRGGSITVEYSLDKGTSWNQFPSGTVMAGAITQRFRLFKQFVSRTIRFRMTTTDPLTVAALHMKYKLEFEH